MPPALRLFSLILLLLAACAPSPAPAGTSELVVFAAASLNEPFTRMAQDYEASHSGLSVSLNFAGSNQLAQQIIQGAPADVFASANPQQAELLVQAGLAQAGDLQVFTHNRLVVVYPAGNPAHLGSLQDLASPGLRLILADPQVPVGAYARQFLLQASQDPAFEPGFADRVSLNVVSYEANVKAVVNKVVLGEADAGIVYTSDVTSENRTSLGQLEIPEHLNVLASYLVLPLAEAGSRSEAQGFIAFVLSPDGQTLLAEAGFSPLSGAP